MRWRRLSTALLATVLLAAPATAAAQSDAAEGAMVVDPGQTVVSLTFDDGYAGQELAAGVLADSGMAGTFYVNSGTIGYPAYLTVGQLRDLAVAGHEVGGHSLDHEHLERLDAADVRAQVCDDRATLAALGLDPRSFAYPYGLPDDRVRRVVQECGYSSARDSSGLYDSPADCGSCPRAEDLANMDTWRIRTGGAASTLSSLQQRVVEAEQSGGGWLVLVFHHVCSCPERGSAAVTPADFAAFVQWLSARGPGTRVATVGQVAGGSLRPVVGRPLERIVSQVQDRSTYRSIAFTLGGVGIGQSQVIASGVSLAVLLVLGYRIGTRGKRYAQRTR